MLRSENALILTFYPFIKLSNNNFYRFDDLL